MTANYVARETGWDARLGAGRPGDERPFAPIETYEERLDALLAGIRSLGFDAVDVWGAHLAPEWARTRTSRLAGGSSGTASGRDLRDVGRPGQRRRACELARGLGAT